MNEKDLFYQRLGASRALGPSEQLILPGGVWVQADESAWTAVFRETPSDAYHQKLLLELCDTHQGLVAFSTRSGWLGLRWRSGLGQALGTEGGLVLSAVLRALDLSPV